MKRKAFAVCAMMICAMAVAGSVEWEFPRLGNCHEGMPFSDGITGVLVLNGPGDSPRRRRAMADILGYRKTNGERKD